MNFYNTGNPVPSNDPRDLDDNAKNLDLALNSGESSFVDRKGVERKTINGYGDAFNAFLSLQGWSTLGVYSAGISIISHSQVVEYQGQPYALKASVPASISAPYITTGNWTTESANFKLVGDNSLRQDISKPEGAGIVGFDPSINYPAGSIGSALGSSVDSVLALLSAPASSGIIRTVASYHNGWAVLSSFDPRGGGQFVYDPSILKNRHDGGIIISPSVPWDGAQATLSAFLAGTGETSPGGSGCWVRATPKNNVFEFGARGDNTTNDIASFQKGLDSIRRVSVPNSSYSMTGTLLYKTNGCCLIGESMTGTKLNFTGEGPVLKNPDSATTTRLFCELRDLNINAAASGSANVVDWKSIQFGVIDRVWILGQPTIGNCALNMEATWVVTECTYNSVSRCYMGNTAICIRVGDGANNNTVSESRFQPGGTMTGSTQLTGAIGILLNATQAERISNFNIVENGFEYPFNLATGINVQQNCNGVFMRGNRFEQLATGIIVGGIGNRHIQGANRQDNYFDSCTTNINLSSSARSAAPAVVANGSYTGAGSISEVGNAFGMTAARTGAGAYVFTFLDTTYPNTGYTVQVTASQPITIVSKTTLGFSIITQNISISNTDAASIDVTVYYNQ